jgi:thiol-disulfide isomerase/thioredoxin
MVLQRPTPQTRLHFDQALALFESVTRDHATAPEAARACYMQGSTHLFQDQLEAADLDYSRVLESFAADRNYFSKALDQRAGVRRHKLENQAAILDLRRWVKEVGSPPEQLSKMHAQLARALLLDKPAPRYAAERWYNSDPLPLEGQVGMVVGLYFFATWCANCEAELPFMFDLERRLAPRGVRLIGVVDQAKGQSAELVQKFLSEKGIQFAVLQDNGATSAKYKAGTIPMLALIDRLGTLRWLDNPSTLLESTIDQIVDVMPEPAKSADEK